jgi:RNA polymerase sigma-70 factor (ECF subfamily)
MPQLSSFLAERPRLLALAYRLLGSRSEAEDAVQELWLRWQAVELQPDNVQAYLTRMLSNLCLDQLRSRRRQAYTGPWLPEPQLDASPNDPEALHGRWQTLSLAFLLLLEQLTPLQRVIWVLREVFEYPYGELADLLQRDPATCRKAFQRAQQRLGAPAAAQPGPADTQLAQQCLLACLSGDSQRLLQLLASEAELHSDGGGVVLAALRPIYGADKILRFFAGLRRKASKDMAAQFIHCNGAPALALFSAGQLISLLCCEVHNGQVVRLLLQRNPHKLHGLLATAQP